MNAPGEHRTERAYIDRRRALIAPLMVMAWDGSLFDGNFRKTIRAHAKSIRAPRTTVNRVVQEWLENGMTDSAFGSRRHFCGGKNRPKNWRGPKPSRQKDGGSKGIALTEEVRAAFDWSVKWLSENVHRPRSDGFIAMTHQFFSEGLMMIGNVEVPKPIAEHLRPTESQFHRYARKVIPEADRTRIRKGEKYYQLNVAPVFATTSGRSFGPGSMSHLDSSPMAIQLVDTATRCINLGQPTLYLVIDDFSSVIEGRLVTLDDERTEDAALAIADAFIGVIKAPRAMPGKPQQADVPKFITKEGFTDKGGAYLAELTDSIYQRMGSSVANPPGGSPNQRGKGEQRFNMTNAFTDWMPGAIDKPRRGKSVKKRGADASLTVTEYTTIVDEFILGHNSTHRPENAPPESVQDDGRPRTAFDLMLWGFKHRGAPDRCDAHDVRLCLYEHVLATVNGHGRGLEADGFYYQTPEGSPGPDFTRGGGVAKGKWWILRDRERVGSAWLLIDEGKDAIALEVTMRSLPLAELTVAELKALRRREQEGARAGRYDEIIQRSVSNTVIGEIADVSKRLKGAGAASKGTGVERVAESAIAKGAVRVKMMSAEVAVGLSTKGPARPIQAVPKIVARTTDADEFRAVRRRLTNEEGLI